MGLKEVKSHSKLRSRSETLPEREAGDGDAVTASAVRAAHARPGHTSLHSYLRSEK